MTVYEFLVIMGSLIAASGTVPYIIATMKRTTKPRIVTWLTWSLLTSLAAAAAFSDGQLGAGLFALLGAVSTGVIVIAGLRYGDRTFTKLDGICQVSVIVGLVVWLLLKDPAIAVWVAIIIDCVGLVPTIKHAWQTPHEETPITYVLVGIGGGLTVTTAIGTGQTSVTAIGYPLYAGVSLGLLAVMIIIRKRSAIPVINSTTD